MKIAIIGSGDVGSALAEKWSAAGHAVVFGTREPSNFKGKAAAQRSSIAVKTIAAAILANTPSREVVKCFNTTGFNNMQNTVYGNERIDMFMAGDSESAKERVRQLALDAGFAECYDVGGNDKFELMEQFAFFWINLAMMQGQGRDIGFKLLKR